MPSRGSPTPLPASIEATPRQAVSATGPGNLLPKGTSVYLTALGTDTIGTTVSAAARLRDLGYKPVPHIAARSIPSQAALTDFLARITGEAGVEDVLVIGGGARRPVGPYSASIQLLETGLLDRYGICRIGIAGHPEGSPDISDAAIEEALHQKAAFASRTGAALRIVTQFGFDPGSTIRWLEDLSTAGFDIPVHLGVAGPAKISTLLKYAAMCGVGPSLQFLKSGTGLLTAISTSYSPEAYVEPIERWHEASANSVLAGLQIFPFGGFDTSANWLFGRGSFTHVNENGDRGANLKESNFS